MRPDDCSLHPAGDASAWLLLLRHAPSSWNDEQRRQGWADPPLTATAVESIRDWPVPSCLRAAVASDLRRADDTATLIATRAGWPPVAVRRTLREQDQGAWTGLTKAQIKKRWPGAMRDTPRRPLDGETIDAVLARVVPTLSELAAQHRGNCTLVVTHHEVIRAVERALGLDAPAVPHLEGRWLHVDLRDEVIGTIDALSAGELTDGRAPVVSPAGSGAP